MRVVPLEGRRDISHFIKVPWTVYAGDPNWIPPLLLERRQHLSRRRIRSSSTRGRSFWIAYRGDQPVGRISAQVDDLHIERYEDATGFFGLLEAVDDPEVFARLLSAAEDWLREQGMQRVIGPFNLSINDDIGLLVDGFDTPPMFLMSHGHPYYDARVTRAGLPRRPRTSSPTSSTRRTDAAEGDAGRRCAAPQLGRARPDDPAARTCRRTSRS